MMAVRFFLLPLLLTHLKVAASSGEEMEGPALASFIASFVEAERGTPFWAVDSSETRYGSVAELWKAKLPEEALLSHAHGFWMQRNTSIPSVIGMEHENAFGDLDHTRGLVARVLASRLQAQGASGAEAAPPVRCLSMCAGIGREARGALLPAGCTTIDLLEPQAHYLDAARGALEGTGALGRAFNVPAQDHDFAAAGEVYDLVFLGWCTQFFPDRALLRVLRAAAAHLAPSGGALVVKDNESKGADAVYNDKDHFVIRSAAYSSALMSLGAPGLAKLAEDAPPQWPGNYFPLSAVVWVRAEEVAQRSQRYQQAAAAEEGHHQAAAAEAGEL